MAYKKQNFTNGQVLTAEQLTHIEDGIVELEKTVENIPDSGDVDLTGYATEKWVCESYQPKGNYLTTVPDGYAKAEDIPTKPEDIGAQPSGNYLTKETDPTVPSWAKQQNKPTYTASEVGALPNNTKIPSKTSDLTNDSGFITGYTETDPTVPAWAKAPNKPTYTADEVGAQPKGSYLTEVPAGYATEEFVTNKIAEAELGDKEVDLSGYALKSEIPTKVGQLQNDKGYLTEHTEIVTTAGTGSAYTATVNSIKALTAGVNFIMIPHVVSASTTPTLNVNGLGAKTIRQPLTTNTSATAPGTANTWLVANKPVRVMYDGTYWKTVEIPRPSATGIYGTVPVESGGTGGTTQETACSGLGAVAYIAQTLTDEQKKQARENIGALGVAQVRVSEITLTAANWTERSMNLYSQEVSISGVTEYSQVDLTPSVEQLVVFYEKDLAFVTENENGTVTVYAIGQKPSNDYTMQVTITEVNV